MSQPSTTDNTMTSEEHDQEVEEYIWNLMGKSGLLSEMKSQIAQFVQNNGKTKEKVTVDVTRVNPVILSMIYEYLKWVGMKNTCTLLLCESPIQFDTSPVTYEVSTNDSSSPPPVPELCMYVSGKRRNNEVGGKSFNSTILNASSPLPFKTSTPSSVPPAAVAVGAAATALNQTFNILSSTTKTQMSPADQSGNISEITEMGSKTPSLSLSPPPLNVHKLSDLSGLNSNIPATTGAGMNGISNANVFIVNPSSNPIQNSNENVNNATSIDTIEAPKGLIEVNDSSESEPTTTSASLGKSGRHSDKKDRDKDKVSSQQQKSLSESSSKKSDKDKEKGKELKPSNSDQSVTQKSREQLQFGFMTEKQKMEALNKKFSGSELIPKKKSSSNNNDDSAASTTTTTSHKTVSGSKTDKDKIKSLSLSKKESKENSEKFNKDKDKEREPENLMDISNPWKNKSHHSNSVNHNNNITSELDFEDESISDLHDSTAEDITQDLSMDSDSKVIAANIAECEHLMKLK